VQDDRSDATASVTVCAFTADSTDAALLRLLVEADEATGIRASSRLMIDMITTIPRSELRERIGQLSDDETLGPRVLSSCSSDSREPDEPEQQRLARTSPGCRRCRASRRGPR
jgi:hypothetical protein